MRPEPIAPRRKDAKTNSDLCTSGALREAPLLGAGISLIVLILYAMIFSYR